MSIKNLKVEELVIDPKHPAFSQLPKEIYPDINNRKIEFELHGLGPEYYNAIRVCTLQEIDWKALEVNPDQIKYTDSNREPDILIPEFCKRIGLIRINQDISDDAVFSLQAVNSASGKRSTTSPDVQYQIVYSGDLKQTSGGKMKGSTRPFDSRYRLAALSPGKVIRVSGIGVVTGKGYENAKFTTCSFTMRNLDYMDVDYLSDKEQITSHMTALADIQKEAAKSRATATRESKVIVIPDSGFLAACPKSMQDKIKNRYDIILSDSKIQPTSSAMAKPKHVHMSFTFFCEVDPKEVLVRSLQTLKDRLQAIRKYLQAYADGSLESESSDQIGFIEITLPDSADQLGKQVPTILIRGESYTIGNLIVKTVLELDPKISLVNYKIIHPSNRSVLIRVVHAQPIKIVIDALTKCHDTFDALQKQITK